MTQTGMIVHAFNPVKMTVFAGVVLVVSICVFRTVIKKRKGANEYVKDN